MTYCYTMTKKVLARLENENRDYCRKCGKRLKLNDSVVSRETGKQFSHYHKICFEKMFFEPSESLPFILSKTKEKSE
jgi:hypothetical protein